ncbi:SPW repeat protein [Mycobacterium sp. NPDC048908]|uniref:SPW repeat domain-containing protein n=1 Tax=Mycobacterium sp. NPDC048908 TaxID=3364292 RepID=UPI0037147AAF
MVARGKSRIGLAAVVVGAGAVVTAITTSSTPLGGGIAVGFAAFIAFFGMLAVLTRDRRSDHWGLVIVGLAMVTVPFLGNGPQADPGASWTCWAAGGLAMVLGAAGLTTLKTSIDNGHNRIGGGEARRSVVSTWIGRATLAIGLVTVARGVALPGATIGTAVLIGLGGLAAVIALWSLLAVDPTYDFLALAITGFALFLSPWVGGFIADNAAMTAWVVGALTTTLGVVGYLRGDQVDSAMTAHSDASAHMTRDFGWPDSSPDSTDELSMKFNEGGL